MRDLTRSAAQGTLVGRARFAGHAVAELGADAGYASQASYAQLGIVRSEL